MAATVQILLVSIPFCGLDLLVDLTLLVRRGIEVLCRSLLAWCILGDKDFPAGFYFKDPGHEALLVTQVQVPQSLHPSYTYTY